MAQSVDEGSDRDLLTPYWLRTVRVGLVVTGLTIVALLTVLFLPGRGPIDTRAVLIVLAAAAAEACGIAMLPWRHLFERGMGMAFMYAWSGADILLVTAAVGLSGGFRSPFFAVYFLTTVFFGASYPPKAQVALLGFTFLCYLTALDILGCTWPRGSCSSGWPPWPS